MKLTNLLFIAILAIFSGNAFAGEPIFPDRGKDYVYPLDTIFGFALGETEFARHNWRLHQNFQTDLLEIVQTAMIDAGYQTVLTAESLPSFIKRHTTYEDHEFSNLTNSGKTGQEILFVSERQYFKGKVAVFRYGRCAVVLWKACCGNLLKNAPLPEAIKAVDPVITDNMPEPAPQDALKPEEPQILVKKKQPVAITDEQKVTTTDDGGIYVRNGEQEVKISANIAKGANNILNISNHTTNQAAAAPVEIREVPVYYRPEPAYTYQEDDRPYEPPVYYPPPVQQKPVKYKPERNGGGWVLPTVLGVLGVGAAVLAANNHSGYGFDNPCGYCGRPGCNGSCRNITGYKNIPSSYSQSFSFADREVRKGMNGQWQVGGPKSNLNP